MFTALMLFGAGLLAGVVNSLAGGGSFISFPALLWAGVPPVMANATNTFSSLPGYASGAIGYWKHIKPELHRLPLYVVVGVIGSLLGAELLLRVSDDSFTLLLPWLMALTVLLFAYGAQINAFFSKLGKGRRGAGLAGTIAMSALLLMLFVYGGFFNGGLGIILLAYLSLAGMSDVHTMNGLKLLMSCFTAGIAVAWFALAGSIAWLEGGYVFAGTLIGGFVAARLAQHVPHTWLRRGIITYGLCLTVLFTWQAYFQAA